MMLLFTIVMALLLAGLAWSAVGLQRCRADVLASAERLKVGRLEYLAECRTHGFPPKMSIVDDYMRLEDDARQCETWGGFLRWIHSPHPSDEVRAS